MKLTIIVSKRTMIQFAPTPMIQGINCKIWVQCWKEKRRKKKNI